MDYMAVRATLLCGIVFSVSSALPQYSPGAPPYSNAAAGAGAGAGGQYVAPQQYPTSAAQYSTAGPQYASPSAPQYASTQSPPYNQRQTTPIPILDQNQQLNPDGSYSYGYQTGNGISAEERGAIKNLGSPENEINSVQGYYSYPGLDGVQYTLTYTADENGFVPQAAHLPTPPPVPAELLKAYEALPPDNNEYDEKGFPISRQPQPLPPQ